MTARARVAAVPVPDSTWMGQGACLGHPNLPWTTDTTALPRRTATRSVQAMTRVCAGCPVRQECAAFAEDTAATGGFWAGHDRSTTQLALFTTTTTATATTAATATGLAAGSSTRESA